MKSFTCQLQGKLGSKQNKWTGKINALNSFIYLGSSLSQNRNINNEIDLRIPKARLSKKCVK